MAKFSDPQQQKPENVPINGKILSAGRSAYSVYQRKIKEDKTEDEKERKGKEAERTEAARKKAGRGRRKITDNLTIKFSRAIKLFSSSYSCSFVFFMLRL